MLHRFRDRFGTAGLAVAIVALVAALAGTAVAASGALTGKQKKEVEKIAKKYAGAPGAPGAAGPAGPAGAAGAKGDNGAPGEKGEKGAKGDPGTPGTPGKDGKSVDAIEIPTSDSSHCQGQGGAFYEVEESAEATEVCNGTDGKDGSPWTAGGTLPKGATETGMWAMSASAADAGTESENEGVIVPISFPVQLAAELGPGNVHIVGNGGGGVCTGNAGHPKAPEGVLCVYKSVTVNSTLSGIYRIGLAAEGATPAGALLYFEGVTDHAYGYGSWAVTGS
jgi:hypothetical protein